jgi:sortase A
VATVIGPKAKKRVTPSTLVASALVAGASAMAWFGGGSNDSRPDASQTETMAAPADQVSSEALATGTLPTRIVVSSAGIDADVVEVGVVVQDGQPSWETAWRAAGHHIDSARPGQPGNVVISGHVSVADSTNFAVFQALDRVTEGDIVEVHTGDEVYRYAVDRVAVVDPSATNVLRSDHTAMLTLITCTKDLKHRLVVTGRLI